MTKVTTNGIMQTAKKVTDRDIGVVVVNYNTPGIISRSVLSIYQHVENVLIIDNSDQGNDSFRECDELSVLKNVSTIHTFENLGHGKGLNLGISCLINQRIIIMDSDATLLKPSVIKEMAEATEDPEVYGVGLVVNVTKNGVNVDIGIPYLHPYFAMFKRETYFEWPLFIHHGAPFIKTMVAIRNRMKVVNIPNITEYCEHEHRRTRDIAGSGWLKNWES